MACALVISARPALYWLVPTSIVWALHQNALDCCKAMWCEIIPVPTSPASTSCDYAVTRLVRAIFCIFYSKKYAGGVTLKNFFVTACYKIDPKRTVALHRIPIYRVNYNRLIDFAWFCFCHMQLQIMITCLIDALNDSGEVEIIDKEPRCTFVYIN